MQIVAFVGCFGLFIMKDVTGESELPDDFRNGALDFGWDTFNDETRFVNRGVEFNHEVPP